MIFFQSLSGMGMIYLFKGNSAKNFAIGRTLLEYGESHSNLRSIVVGHIITGYGHYTQGDFKQAIECCKKAIELLNDPLFSEWPKLFLCMNYLIDSQIDEAEDLIEEILPFLQKSGHRLHSDCGRSIARGRIGGQGPAFRGLKILEKDLRIFEDNGRYFSLYVMETAVAEIYFRIAIRAQGLNLRDLVKNLGFIITKLPFSRRRAEACLKKIIQVGRQVESQGFVQGQALLNLGCLQRLKGRRPRPESFTEALQILERCNSETCLLQAREALSSVS